MTTTFRKITGYMSMPCWCPKLAGSQGACPNAAVEVKPGALLCLWPCRAVAKEIEGKGNKGKTALIRMYPIPHTLYHPHGCWMAEPGAVEAMPIDPCHFSSELLRLGTGKR